MNDPQRPILLDGVWHYYYLYNAGYPKENGTEWYHLTSTDLVHWKEEGVAITKYKNGLGDIETGSAVVDHDNSAGFGKGAVIAVMTQQDQGIQRQSLFYSTDNGYSFTAYSQNPVMENPGEPDWRDPKIIRDEAHGQWVMALAEGRQNRHVYLAGPEELALRLGRRTHRSWHPGMPGPLPAGSRR